jgi:hypothetical protein
MNSSTPGRDPELSRAYRASPQDLPSAAIDAAILAAARRAVRAAPLANAGRNLWLPHWSSPLAASAVVVLAVSVLFLAIEQRPAIAPEALRTALPPAMTAPPAPAGSAPALDAAADTTETSRKAAMPTAASPVARMIVPPLPDSTRLPLPTPATVVAGSARARAGQFAEYPAQSPSPLAAKPADVANRAAAADLPLAPKEPAGESLGEAAVGRMTTPATAAIEATAAAPASLAAKELVTAATALPTYESAEDWLKRIESLRRQGKLKQVREELLRLRNQYPQLVLPKNLAALAPAPTE